MNHDITKIKALQFEYEIDKLWWNDNTKPMNQLLEMVGIPYDRTDLMDFGYLLSEDCIDTFGLAKTIQMMASFIPFNCQNVHTDESEGQTCLNQKCSSYNNGKPNCYTIFSDCWADIHLYIYLAIAIGGKSALKELKKEWSDIDSEIFYLYFHNNKGDIKKGIYEKELYEDNLSIKDVVTIHLKKIGDDKMSKPFFVTLSELNESDDISVYWTDGMMYVEDESDGQAVTSLSLFQAYRFAVLINASIFDYTASDKEVKELSEQMLELIDEDFYKVNIWDYLDDIKDDFKNLTNIEIGIDNKRQIVCAMTDMQENNSVHLRGSATFIAKTLWDYIKGNKNLYQGCDNKTINQLADKYLQTDDYDIIKFAEELHKKCQYKMDMPKDFNEYLIKSTNISEKCYYLLGHLIKHNRKYKNDILVGYIDWFGDYEENERYIYCHINAVDNEIYFYENHTHSSKCAYLHDIAFFHLVNDPTRIQQDIVIKFTDEYIDNVVADKMDYIYGTDDPYFGEDWGYNYCHMYGTSGQYVL